MTDTSPDLLEALRSGAVRVVPVEATQDMAAAGEVALVGVLRGVNYFMPDDGMRRVLNAAFSASPDHTAAVVALIEGLRKERDAESRNAGRYADEALALRGDIAAADALRIMWHDRALAAEAERDALRERAERAFVAGLEAAAQYLEACNDYGDRLKATEIRALTQDQPNDGE